MTTNSAVKKAIYNMGGPTLASRSLQVSVSAVNKWIRRGAIPNLDLATRVAGESGFSLRALRPWFEQEVNM